MQKNIGSKLALYPMPLLVIGAMVDGKVNWLLAGHSGIIRGIRIPYWRFWSTNYKQCTSCYGM